jgi:hypothetical protein
MAVKGLFLPEILYIYGIKATGMKKTLILIIMLAIGACKEQETPKKPELQASDTFNPQYVLPDESAKPGLRGQLMYMPVYSNVPYHIVGVEQFDMSAFVAVHNTDLIHSITITNALYFNKMGKPVFDFLTEGKIILAPLATHDFYVPYEDKSGNGANFIIEWVSDTLVSEPLVESVTISLKPNQSVAVLSKGRIIRELK